MKHLIIVMALTLVTASCAHHDSNVEHHHHDEKQASYDGKCAYSVAHDNMNVSGKKEFSFNHKGMTYYFSSEEKMDLFKKDLDKNVQTANRLWEAHGSRR